ncbi:hypothetical protein COV20_05860 [Candidatus Woesearchaeota archaeon CG10_big_fil_rev_8_21_14_0_10_45_16]|nr:MAG: hypothetical protein COV20_05860 [Candidatus Woesearchaeota archaeon CG10_big_fil_rev_8_21_14_0_10_45_16]
MTPEKLEKLAEEGYDLSEASQFDWPYFNGIGESIRKMINNINQGSEKGLVFFPGERGCYVVPTERPYTSLSVRKKGLILAPSKDTYVPCAGTAGLLVYSSEDQSRREHIRVEFPFRNTEVWVVESARGVEIMLFDDVDADTISREAKFYRVYDADIYQQFRDLIHELKQKGPKRYIHFKTLSQEPVFYLPHAKPIVPR